MVSGEEVKEDGGLTYELGRQVVSVVQFNKFCEGPPRKDNNDDEKKRRSLWTRNTTVFNRSKTVSCGRSTST